MRPRPVRSPGGGCPEPNPASRGTFVRNKEAVRDAIAAQRTQVDGRFANDRMRRLMMSVRRSSDTPAYLRPSRITTALGGLLLLLSCLTLPAWANLGDLPDEEATTVKVRAYLSHSAMPAGGTGTVLVTLDIPSEFHIQVNDFLDIFALEDAPVEMSPVQYTPNGIWGEEEEGVLKDRTSIRSSFKIKDGTPEGEAGFVLYVGYQGCSEGPVYACFPPEEIEVSFQLNVLPGGGEAIAANETVFAANPAGGGGSAPEELGEAGATEETAGAVVEEEEGLRGLIKRELAKGSLLAFILIFLGGIVSSFTPCVYPMIPITISYVGGRASTKAHGFFLSVFFVLGLALTYAVLGLLAGAAGLGFGELMQSPIAIGIVAAIFIAMGASMLGLFDIVVPSSVTTGMTTASAGSGGSKGGGIIGAILMGATTGLVASPCVGPILIVLLTFVAETGNLFLGFWILFTFAAGLGMLFLVLGTFSGAIQSLPGAGSWMDTVKHGFGVILLGMAIFYLKGILDPGLTRLITGVYLVIVGVFTGAFHPLPAEPTWSSQFRKALGMLVFIAGVIVFVAWMLTVVNLPMLAAAPGAAVGADAHGGRAEPEWLVCNELNPADQELLAQAAAEGKPAMLDFWATWCAACIELDHKTWSDPAVYAEAARFMPIKMDGTNSSDYKSESDGRYGVLAGARPTVIFFDSQGNEARRFTGFKGPEDVLEIMKSVH